MELLTTYTHDSDLQAVTAPPVITTAPTKSSPACCVFISRSLETASNNTDSSASYAQVLYLQPHVQNSTQLSLSLSLNTDGQSASLSWNKELIWDLRPDFFFTV
jgi:hypothetical protein